jgi:Family of unknown function (DUF6228)
MPDLIVRSNRRSDELALAPDVNDYWRATVEFDGLRATVRFYEPEMGSLPAYFAALAEAWRGWDGERVWQSLESDCRLAAVHDGLGSIGLLVRLRTLTDFVGPPLAEGWHAEGALVLDAGSLDDLTRRAEKLYSDAR